MKQFKVGDTVRLKKNLKVGKVYVGHELYEKMVFEGAQKVRKEGIADNSVMLEGNPFYYPNEMLVRVPKKKSSDD